MLATVHYVGIFVYACVIAQASIDLTMLRKSPRAEGQIRYVLFGLLTLILLQSLSLVYLQINWLYENEGLGLHESVSLMWLAFDLFNGLVMLVYATSIRIFLGWKAKGDYYYGNCSKVRQTIRR